MSVVLVHGGFVDGSGWQGVYTILQQHGYRVGVVQNPTLSLEDDVAVNEGGVELLTHVTTDLLEL